MFKKLRARLHHYFLRKKLKDVKHPHQTMNYERARTIAVIFDATLPENLTAAKKFNQDLSGLNKRAHFFAFLNHKEPAGSLPFEYMTKQQVSRLFIPQHPKVEELITKQYDLLINLCTDECLPLEYICALSNATYRVGRFIPGKTYCYDMMIDMNGKRDMNYFIEQLNEYLKMIK